MRKAGFFAAAALFLALPARADDAARARVERYFSGWYSVCPGNRVAVAEAREVVVPGYAAYRVERACELKNRNESNITLVDNGHKEIFVGQVLHDDTRHDRPFSAAEDLPVVRGVLQDQFGLPVVLSRNGAPRPALVPIEARIQEAPGAAATLRGFVSEDGASILLGEFFPLSEMPEATRARLLAEEQPAPPAKAIFTITAFIDFQCERCRVRTPQIRDYAWSHGGAMAIRYLPIVKVHDWAFAAAEAAAGLANVSPALADKFEAAIFPRAAGMTDKAARDLASDIAESAGARDAFLAEISSGRARDHVVSDINLALKLGLNGTPVFFYRGTWLTSEPDLAERYIEASLSGAATPAGQSPPR
jgi:Thioredoxin